MDKTFKEERWTSVDSTFFDVFTFNFLMGSSEGALNKPNTVVITRSMASKYFGDEDPMGKMMKADNENYMITGVIEDMPSNSHFHFDFLASLKSNIRFQSTIEFDSFAVFKALFQSFNCVFPLKRQDY